MPYYASNLITGNLAATPLTGVQALRRPPDIATGQGDVQAVTGSIVFASGVNLAANDVIELAILPADHVPFDFILVNDDFDSATTVTIKLGLMSGLVGDAGRVLAAVGTEGIASGSTVLQAPAYTRCAAATWAQVGPIATADRSVGMGIVAAPTNIASIRRIDFVMLFRAASYGA